jgi:hypothetical protein
VREVWKDRTGLTLEQVTATYSTMQIVKALTYWRIESEVRASERGESSGSADATQAAYERAKAAKLRGQGAPEGVA